MKCDVCERDLPRSELLAVLYEGDEQGAGKGWLCEACYDAWCDDADDTADLCRRAAEAR